MKKDGVGVYFGAWLVSSYYIMFANVTNDDLMLCKRQIPFKRCIICHIRVLYGSNVEIFHQI